MLVIIGYVVVVASVFGGFVMNGGHLAALWQPLELVMIGGAALGAFFVGNNGKSIKATLAAVPSVFKGSRHTKDLYMEMMSLLFDVLSKVRKEGLMSIEGDIDKPEESPLFSKYPGVLQDHHIVEFMTDGSHRVHYVRHPFHREPDFGVTSVNYAFPELLANGQVPS